jgi:hypothetical protein
VQFYGRSHKRIGNSKAAEHPRARCEKCRRNCCKRSGYATKTSAPRQSATPSRLPTVTIQCYWLIAPFLRRITKTSPRPGTNVQKRADGPALQRHAKCKHNASPGRKICRGDGASSNLAIASPPMHGIFERARGSGRRKTVVDREGLVRSRGTQNTIRKTTTTEQATDLD